MEGLLQIKLAAILGLGVLMQWIAVKLRIPSILLLLLSGVIIGPATGYVNPEEIFGDLLLPMVSLSVAIILFEGGLSLRFSELPAVGSVAFKLVTLGVMITFFIATLAGQYFLGLSFAEAATLGAVLVVTGPTVIGPLLRHIRPSGKVGPLLKWEGIVIDPVGATLGLLVFEAFAGGEQAATGVIIVGVLKTLLVGGVLGAVAAGLLVVWNRRRWIPDALQVPCAFALVLVAFAFSNYLQRESGLLTVTLMGILFANQRTVPVRQLIEFKEHLRVLILAMLFIVLSARLDFTTMQGLGWGVTGFVAALVLVARPLSVALCSIRSTLTLQERLFLMCMAPRGIVAASITSVFALRLSEMGYADAEKIMPATFVVIGSTVLIYGVGADVLARLLGLSQSNPQGIVLIGAHRFARELAKALQALNLNVQLVDKNWSNVAAARLDNLTAHYADALSERLLENLQLDSMGRVLALTANEETNSLAAIHYGEVFGRSEVYQLSHGESERGSEQAKKPLHLRGRILFGKDITYDALLKRMREGAIIKVTKLSGEFDFEAFKLQNGPEAIPLMVVSESGKVSMNTVDQPVHPQPGQRLISLAFSEKAGVGEAARVAAALPAPAPTA